MATIRASCPECGDIELTTKDMKVRVCAADNSGAYVFRCPECQLAVTKSAEQRIVDLLVSSGVVLEIWRLPAELSEVHEGNPLTHDDLLEFHELLQSDAWFSKLASMTIETDK